MRFPLVILLLLYHSLAGASAMWQPKNLRLMNQSGSSYVWGRDQDDLLLNVESSDVLLHAANGHTLAEMRNLSHAKSEIISSVLNIQDWNVFASGEKLQSGPKQLFWLAGSYLDSNRDLVYFYEIYEIGAKESFQYLVTRPRQKLSLSDINSLFNGHLNL